MILIDVEDFAEDLQAANEKAEMFRLLGCDCYFESHGFVQGGGFKVYVVLDWIKRDGGDVNEDAEIIRETIHT